MGSSREHGNGDTHVSPGAEAMAMARSGYWPTGAASRICRAAANLGAQGLGSPGRRVVVRVRDVAQLAPDQHDEEGRAGEGEPERGGHAPTLRDHPTDRRTHDQAAVDTDQVHRPD